MKSAVADGWWLGYGGCVMAGRVRPGKPHFTALHTTCPTFAVYHAGQNLRCLACPALAAAEAPVAV
jgi:hypothetical protein